MPAGPGETLLTTLFADVHYYFNDPSAKPTHHRFDRGSYIYLFHNAVQQQAKLEVANHAGTPEQDAFHGYLNATSVRYSHLQPTLFTLSIDPASVQDQSAWHLPAFNEKNEQKYLYKIHTIDLYLWTEKDATTFLGHLRKALGSDRLDVKNAPRTGTPHSEHRDSMSPVVQQLERTAIGSQFHQQRAGSTVSATSIPGPPTPATSGGASPQAAPIAYNPAAPAAPEPVAYREKTPPPPDAATGTGLTAAAKYDHVPQTQPQYASFQGAYQNSNQTTPQHAYFSGPPQQQLSNTPSQTSLPGPPGGMPPPPQQQRTPSFGPMAQSTLPQSPPPNQQSFQRASTFGAPPGQTQYANYNPQQQQYGNYPGTPGYNPQQPPTPSAPPAYAGHTPMQSPGLPPPPPAPQQQQGPGSYGYNPHGAYTGDIHNQAYRPTEAESSHHTKPPKRANTGSVDSSGKPGKLNLEGKAQKYLNKLDKLW